MKRRATSRWPLLILVGLVLVAAALRLWQLPVLPPGLWYDEAINGVDIRMILSGRDLPVYFHANNGREPLFIYLQALSVALLGPTPFALRIVSACAGILAIPAVYLLARRLWGGGDQPAGPDPVDATWMALFAAAGLAVSFWHLSLSRIGLRATMLPLVSTLAIAVFWKTWTGARRRDYVLAGAWFAAALYTYTAARALPLVPVLFAGVEALRDLWRRRRGSAARQELARAWRHRLIGLVLMGTVLALLLIPLVVAAGQDQYGILGRAGMVSVLETSPGSTWGAARQLLTNAGSAVRNFYDRGDLNIRHNLPGRPANDPLLAVLFTLGWLTALWRIRQPQCRLLLIWLGVMALPTVLSTETPHSLRGAGELPPLALLYALGAYTGLKLLRRPAPRAAGAPLLLAAIVLISGGLTARDYFGRWAQLPKLGNTFSLQQQLGADTLAGLLAPTSPAQPIVTSYRLLTQPQAIFALGLVSQAPLGSSGMVTQTTSPRFVLENFFDLRQPMFLLQRGPAGITSIPLQPFSEQDANRLLQSFGHDPKVQMITAANGQEGWPRLFEGSLPPEMHLAARSIADPLAVAFANGMRLVGYETVQVPALENEPARYRVQVTLFWELAKSVDPWSLVGCNVFVHLVNGDAVWNGVSGAIPKDYLFSWHQFAGDTLQDVRWVPVPQAMPPGKAHFEVGMECLDPTAGPEGLSRTAVVGPRGEPLATQVNLGAMMIDGQPPQADLGGLLAVGARFADEIELVGWKATRAAGALQVELGWRAVARSAADYTAFVHLIDAGGRIVSQDDRPPAGTDNPTTRWVPGETVRTVFTLPAASDVDAGRLSLRIGLYEPVSGEQLPLTSAPDTADAAAGRTYLVIPLAH